VFHYSAGYCVLWVHVLRIALFCTVATLWVLLLWSVSTFTVDCTVWFHCSAGYYALWVLSLWITSVFIVDCTVWWGHVWGCSQQAPSTRLEARPLGLRIPGAWLSGLGPGQATPAGCALGCSHLALSLLGLGCWGCLLVCGADQVHTWRLGWLPVC